ncbi:Predicted transcriptional regulator [Halomicrobium zhouii]|uniref:Predicted transcriptional regulator n=1 Tax=Halomicrobium zhouii TaxID=767519 RepID=A0A1I6LXE7_9EURY|nr:winged helix-turn-helix domain-containing protein [Halomicrobium zhouii]SFS07972.1 Predicted transcriptional regulator [Halomicrobium zhouii]
MSTDETPDDDPGESDETDGEVTEGAEDDRGESDVRERIEQEADRAVEQFDEGIVDLLAWVLDTETRARIYVHLRQRPHSTSEEIAEGTGLYPSTVREALAELHEEGTVLRQKRQNDGAGNNPYEYATIPPSELVGDVVDDVQEELNTVFNLDRYLDTGVGGGSDDVDESSSEPVTINVEDETDDGDDGSDDGDNEPGDY